MSAPFTSAQLVDIRRFCGYQAYGNTATATWGSRFFTAYGILEYKMANMSPDEAAVITSTMLPNLTALETALFGTSQNLDTDTASVWKHNKNEFADRWALYANQRRMLCDFLGVPYGPGIDGGEAGRLML